MANIIPADYDTYDPYDNDTYVIDPFDPFVNDTNFDKIFKSINIMAAVVYSLVFVLGVSGNGVVIWATGFRMKKTVNTVWYLNLAVADFLVTALLPLQITWSALEHHWPFGKFMCKTEGMVFHMNMYASTYTLMVISVDRCVCVACPLWARCSGQRTVRKASWVSLGVWVMALAQCIPNSVFRDTQLYGDDKVDCYDNYALATNFYMSTPEEEELHKFRLRAMVITRFLVGFVLPFSVIVSCYSAIIYRLRNNRSLASQSGRPFKIIATVIAAFFLCWLPYHIIRLISFVNYPVYKNTPIGLVIMFGGPITYAMALLNSCLNPLLYVFMAQDFKDVFRSSFLKVLEKAFAEDTPQTDASTDPAITRQMITLSETQGSTGPTAAKDSV